MPKNLQAQIRYITIDKCLRRVNTRWTVESILDACENALHEHNPKHTRPSRRTLFYDFKEMKSGDLGYQAPLICVDKKYYTYSDPNFSISNIPLSFKDLKDLYDVLHLMTAYHRMPLTNELSDIITRLANVMDSRELGNEDHPIIDFDQLSNAPGQKWLHFLFLAIRSKKKLKLDYQSFNDKVPVSLNISPYLLKEYNKRWFLIGFNHNKNAVYTFALDRIVMVDYESLSPFYQAPFFHSKYWYENIIGVTKIEGAAAVDILIKTTVRRADYLNTKPLHHSQKEEKREGEDVYFSFFLIPNYELEAQLLAFAEEIEVLKPLSLRKKITSRVLGAAALYSTPFKG